ncbi:MAG: NHL repeat-containing protein [bacterium]|nr:NHL repeat-containing protein [bacterium]
MKKHNIIQKRTKRSILIWIIGECLTLSGCGAKKNSNVYEIPVYTEHELESIWNADRGLLYEDFENHYTVYKWEEEQTGIESPYGICVLEDAIYISDFSNHCVVRLGKDGELIASYGQLGAEPGNFTNPTAIVHHDNMLYVLDQGNHRVQIFDEEMNYQKEETYAGAVFTKTVYFQDMAIDQDGTIYLSEWEEFADDAAVYYISEEGVAVQLEPHISGVLTEYQGEVYAINTYWLFYLEEAAGLARGAMYGPNFLFKCTRDGLEQICELPYKYAAGDFCIANETIYAVSLYNPLSVQMNRFTMNGVLDSAIYIFRRRERDYANISEEPVQYPWYLDVVDDDHIYVVDSLWKTVYYLEKAN